MFERTFNLIDKKTFEKIQNTKIAIVGLGGVGGTAFEALIRLGFQNITIFDNDNIEISNLNRQIITHQKNIGKAKTEEAKKRALSINPNVSITTKNIFLTKENCQKEIKENFDFIIDACDTISTKIELVKIAKLKNCKIISCMGTANRIDPSKIIITTLNKTSYDPLAKKMRENLKKENLNTNLAVIWSSEVPKKRKDKTLGSIILVPSAAGLAAASFVLNHVLKKEDLD